MSSRSVVKAVEAAIKRHGEGTAIPRSLDERVRVFINCVLESEV